MKHVVFDRAMAGEVVTLRDLPEKVEIPNHSFVSIKLSDGNMKCLPGKVVITNASRIFVEVHPKYNGRPITLFMKEVE